VAGWPDSRRGCEPREHHDVFSTRRTLKAADDPDPKKASSSSICCVDQCHSAGARDVPAMLGPPIVEKMTTGTDPPTIERIVEFHGHMCPGLAMGIRAAEVALEEIGPHSADEEVVAVVETDMCAVDAIQFLTGCTFGKGNLVHRDEGKNAFTFLRRSDGRAVRVSALPQAWGAADPDWLALFNLVRARTATPEQLQRFVAVQAERTERILTMPVEELYDVRKVDVDAPAPARILASIECESCGEPTMETRVRRLDARQLCLACFDKAFSGIEAVAGPSRRGVLPGP